MKQKPQWRKQNITNGKKKLPLLNSFTDLQQINFCKVCLQISPQDPSIVVAHVSQTTACFQVLASPHHYKTQGWGCQMPWPHHSVVQQQQLSVCHPVWIRSTGLKGSSCLHQALLCGLRVQDDGGCTQSALAVTGSPEQVGKKFHEIYSASMSSS